jgi:hypothetical protein
MTGLVNWLSTLSKSLQSKSRKSGQFSEPEYSTQSLSVRLKVFWFFAGGAIVAGSGAIINPKIYAFPHQSEKQGLVTGVLFEPAPCGHSPATAQASGCHFESYTATWQPATCYDYELDMQFRNIKRWKFYADINGTMEVSLTDVESSLEQVWTTWEFHLTQCAWFWKKEVKIGNGEVSGTIDYHQCLDMGLMQDYKFPSEKIITPYWPRFSSCRPPSDISVHQFAQRPGDRVAVDTSKHSHEHGHGS